MASHLESKSDGSLALFINGDLQFDSADERIYHECLALPALAIAEGRLDAQLKVLIIGGGDGLVAREILKSGRVESLNLVDYDPEILTFAANQVSALNKGSLRDPRTTVHVKDAWDFVDKALSQTVLFDIIVSDLTVAEDILGARFHSIDWYLKLSRLLSEKGILAVNGVSPQNTPNAYWSIFNGMLKAGLHARPYHMVIPSFAARGYGDDWGFFLASREPIHSSELGENLVFAQPRDYLVDAQQLRSMFVFSTAFFQYQPQSLPTRAGSDLLLHYLNNSPELLDNNEGVIDAFSFDIGQMFVPEPHSGKEILPPELSTVLAHSINCQGELGNPYSQDDAQVFLHEVLNLMPALDRQHTYELIVNFLEEPTVFLQAIDLPELIARLLKRASELPLQLVKELELLRDKLEEWTGDHLSLLNLGKHVVTILTLVIVVGNLLYPDSVYAKGEHAASTSHAAASHSAAVAGRNGRSGGYWNGRSWSYNRNTVTRPNQAIQSPGPGSTHVPHMQMYSAPKGPATHSSIPRSTTISLNRAIDEDLASYPAVRYRINEVYVDGSKNMPTQTSATAPGAVSEFEAVYRLGPGTDISPTGHPVIRLTDRAYLFVTERGTHVVDQLGGSSLMSLANDEALLNLLRAEIERQQFKLSSLVDEFSASGAITEDFPDAKIDEVRAAIDCLTAAAERLQTAERNRGNHPERVLPGMDLFPSVSVTTDAKYIAVRRESGAIAYLNDQGFFSAEDMSALNEPYPAEFKKVVASFLTRIIRDGTARKDMLSAEQASLSNQANLLRQELAGYESCTDCLVTFGSHLIERKEAQRLTELALKRLSAKIDSLDRHIAALPAHGELAKIALLNLDGFGSA
jgi:spermidine synthase